MNNKHDISEGDEIILYTKDRHTFDFQKTANIKCRVIRLPESDRNWWTLQDMETKIVFHTCLSSSNICGFTTVEEYKSFKSRKIQTTCPLCKKVVTHSGTRKVICNCGPHNCGTVIYPPGNLVV